MLSLIALFFNAFALISIVVVIFCLGLLNALADL